MDQQDQRIQREVADLWSATFGEKPAITADSTTMIRILVACLKDPGPFEFNGPPPKPAPAESSRGQAPGLARLAEPAELGV